MRRPMFIVFALVLVAGGLLWLLQQRFESAEDSGGELVVHCAAGLQRPVREIADRYESEYGTRVRLNFSGSGALEAQLRVAGGDLFIPADYSYIERTRSEGLVEEAEPVAQLYAVIVVAKGNPRGIHSLEDLKREGVRLSVAEPSAAIGEFVRKVLQESGDWEGIETSIVVTKPTVNNVVEDVAGGAVDAGLAWDAVAAQFSEVELVRVPVFQRNPRQAAAGVWRGGQREEALRFLHYLTAEGKGRAVFQQMGFTVPPMQEER